MSVDVVSNTGCGLLVVKSAGTVSVGAVVSTTVMLNEPVVERKLRVAVQTTFVVLIGYVAPEVWSHVTVASGSVVAVKKIAAPSGPVAS